MTYVHDTTPRNLTDQLRHAGLELPLSADTRILAQPLTLYGRPVPNRLCVLPLEGCDADVRGAPTERTLERYRLWAAGGAGLIWMEATAVLPEGRTHARQLMLGPETVSQFSHLVTAIRAQARRMRPEAPPPFLVLQLSHGARVGDLQGHRPPFIAHHSAVLAAAGQRDTALEPVSDVYLDTLPDAYLNAARLAAQCGFDAVDIKSCHGFLLHELLCSHIRRNSRYGGTFSARTRLLRTTVARIRNALPLLGVAVRLNLYDGVPHPWGWGVPSDGSLRPDLAEPVRLAKILRDLGIELVSVTFGNGHARFGLHQRNLTVPWPLTTGSAPQEQAPLETVTRNLALTATFSRRLKGLHVVATTLSWFQRGMPWVAAALVREGVADFAGVGRAALQHPSFARSILDRTGLSTGQVCRFCGTCRRQLARTQPVQCPFRT